MRSRTTRARGLHWADPSRRPSGRGSWPTASADRGGPVALTSAALQLAGLGQLLQGAAAPRAPRDRVRAARPRRRRPLEPRRRCSAASTPTSACRRSCSTTAARSRSRAPSSGTSARGRASCPDDRYERAKVLQWMFFEQYTHEPAIAVVRFLVAYSGEPERHAATDRAADDAGLPRARLDGAPPRRQVAVLRRQSLTLADIALYAYTHVAHEGASTSRRYPAIRAWLDRVAAEPGHVRSTHDRPRPVRAEPDRIAPPRQRAHRRREPALRRRAWRCARARIDDTDPSRTVPGGEAAILDRPRVARGRVGRGAAPSERARRRLRRGRRVAETDGWGRRGTPTARSGSAR